MPDREQIQNDVAVLYERMMEMDGEAINLVVERDNSAVIREPDLTISADALKSLESQMIAWVGSRMMRHWKKSGNPAHHIEVEITVRSHGLLGVGVEPKVPPLKLRVVDGRHRQQGGLGA